MARRFGVGSAVTALALVGAAACSGSSSDSLDGGGASGPSSGAAPGSSGASTGGATGNAGSGGGGSGNSGPSSRSADAGSGMSTGASGSGGAPDAGSGGNPDSGAPPDSGAVSTNDSGTASGGDAGTPVEAGPAATSTPTRPQLTDAQDANDTILKYLAQAGTIGSLVTDNWNSTAGLGPATAFTPRFTVAADGSGIHTTIQAAITADAAVTGATRVYIAVEPGTYRELVCVRAGSTPITLYSTNTDASRTVIVFDNFAGGDPTTANPCNPSSSATLGTFSSATLMAFASGFQAKNLTIANDYPATSSGSAQQAVALMTEADSIVLENVRVLGFQDTLFLHTSDVTKVARVYIKNGFVQGDTDFIFGRATVVLDGGTIDYATSRRGGGGTIVAPSTDPRNGYGILVSGVDFTQEGTLVDSVYLGRAWDNGVASAAAYVPGASPNGQAVIAFSSLGAHIRAAAPWAPAATSARPFSDTGNRLFEYRNSGPGAAQ